MTKTVIAGLTLHVIAGPDRQSLPCRHHEMPDQDGHDDPDQVGHVLFPVRNIFLPLEGSRIPLSLAPLGLFLRVRGVE